MQTDRRRGQIHGSVGFLYFYKCWEFESCKPGIFSSKTLEFSFNFKWREGFSE